MSNETEARNDVMLVYSKLENGKVTPIGIPKRDIRQIVVSRNDGSTLLITANGKISVADSYEDAIAIYNKPQ